MQAVNNRFSFGNIERNNNAETHHDMYFVADDNASVFDRMPISDPSAFGSKRERCHR